MSEKADADRMERIVRKARLDWPWDSLAHDMNLDRYIAGAVLHNEDPGEDPEGYWLNEKAEQYAVEQPLIDHEPLDPLCKHYEGTKLGGWLSAPSRIVFGIICNECRTLGKHARG